MITNIGNVYVNTYNMTLSQEGNEIKNAYDIYKAFVTLNTFETLKDALIDVDNDETLWYYANKVQEALEDNKYSTETEAIENILGIDFD